MVGSKWLEVWDQGSEMRFWLAVMAVVVGISVSGAAQTQPKAFKPKATDADVVPKSMPPAKAPAATSASATSKELHAVERETPKGTGAAHAGKKAPKPVTVKQQKDRNPPMNFGGKGGGGGSGVAMTKQSSQYKGRLKQKGAAGHN
jgi:hypothetical protein